MPTTERATTVSRILVVDDSVVVRRMLSDLLGAAPELEIAATAANGNIALQKLLQTPVDLVVLDVEMPELDGIETASRIRAAQPRLPILMCSSLTARGGEATLRALAAGATDYVAKPSTSAGEHALVTFKAELLAKVRALLGMRTPELARPSVPAPRPIAAARRTPPRAPAVLAIGCSTGGPNALARVFADLPADLGVPILVTQHMPPIFTRMLAERLTATSRIVVKEAEHGDVLTPGLGYVAPGDHHMTLVREGVRVRVVLDQGPPENSCRPAVDVMFRAVAQIYGADVVAAVLTGMGRDGAQGARQIASRGGWVLAQDAASCVVASMPNAVVAAGVADEVVELDRIGTQLAFRVRPRRATGT